MTDKVGGDISWDKKTKIKTQIAVSGVMVIACLVVILSGAYDESYNKWAFGTAGTVLGYWLR